MIKIEAETLEIAYSKASEKLECSITELNIEVVQSPKSGFLGMFKKSAIIVVALKTVAKVEEKVVPKVEPKEEKKPEVKPEVKPEPKIVKEPVVAAVKEEVKVKTETPKKVETKILKTSKPLKKKTKAKENSSLNDIIMPASFVTDQEEDDYDGSDIYEDEEEVYVGEETEICNKSHDEIHQQLAGNKTPTTSAANDNFFGNEKEETVVKPSEVAKEIKDKIDSLFKHACFDIEDIKVQEHDDKTILVEFSGKDAALLIGKEGYRYKALSYMLYNWINSVYQLQLRLEIAEFLKNQEEMIAKYLESVYESIDKDGKAQTKILDGVLVQIALRDLRSAYPDKYVAIRSTRDGAKFIIINSFNNNNNSNNY